MLTKTVKEKIMNDEKKVTIRIPDELHQELVKLSEQDTRSLNGEIIALLREVIARRKAKADN
jgi:hypothetical protein